MTEDKMKKVTLEIPDSLVAPLLELVGGTAHSLSIETVSADVVTEPPKPRRDPNDLSESSATYRSVVQLVALYGDRTFSFEEAEDVIATFMSKASTSPALSRGVILGLIQRRGKGTYQGTQKGLEAARKMFAEVKSPAMFDRMLKRTAEA
jgi:hypothetical protein